MTETFNALFAPASVAVIGASDNPNKVGGRPIHYLRQFGYQGEVFPVNPGRDTIQGYRAYPTLDAIGKTPDAVVIAVSGDATLEQVRVCAEAGVKAAVIMASGFAETGEAGRQRQQQLVDVANAGGMRLVGPNAQGTANFASGAVLNFSTMFMEVAPQDGPIAIISQSGAASSASSPTCARSSCSRGWSARRARRRRSSAARARRPRCARPATGSEVARGGATPSASTGCARGCAAPVRRARTRRLQTAARRMAG